MRRTVSTNTAFLPFPIALPPLMYANVAFARRASDSLSAVRRDTKVLSAEMQKP